ncbi:selenocysteine-specific translation elongation factor [Vibrio mediterranei]
MHTPSPDHAVIGLAGHVDHGKTSLIHALTGIMTAREHEQALGMTQDLGFAYFHDERANTIGMIDVPGHERYLRNMVAGIWCINVLLLVVSVEDGCMPMTLTHTKVAKAMGVKHIVIALSKADKVPPEQLMQMEEEVLETIMDASGIVPDILAVSAQSGHNINELKRLLIENVHASINSQNRSQALPFLYVDRSFSVNGVGTIVTGTLAQGQLSIGDKLRCEPSGMIGTVRSIQTYNQQVETVYAISRVALNVKGLSKKQVQRGDLLLPSLQHAKSGGKTSCVDTVQADFILQNQCIVRLQCLDEHHEHQRNKQVEIALGSWHGMAQLIPIPNTNLARLLLSQALPLSFGQRIVIIENGGKRLLFQAEVVWRDWIPKFKKKAIYQALSELPESLSPQAHIAMLLALQGYYPATITPKSPLDHCLALGHYYVNQHWLDEQIHQLLGSLEHGQSMSAQELAHQAKLDLSIIEPLLQHLKKQKKVHLNYAKWHKGDGASEDELPPTAQQLLKLAREAGLNGLELNKVELGIDKKWLKQLTHQKYLTALTPELYFDMRIYLDLVKAILAHKSLKETTSIQEMKEITGLSRKYIIPLANRMEKDGWIRRDDEVRIILKAWSD